MGDKQPANWDQQDSSDAKEMRSAEHEFYLSQLKPQPITITVEIKNGYALEKPIELFNAIETSFLPYINDNFIKIECPYMPYQKLCRMLLKKEIKFGFIVATMVEGNFPDEYDVYSEHLKRKCRGIGIDISCNDVFGNVARLKLNIREKPDQFQGNIAQERFEFFLDETTILKIPNFLPGSKMLLHLFPMQIKK